MGISGHPLQQISFRVSGSCPSKRAHLGRRETHISVSVFLRHAQETVNWHVSDRASLRRIRASPTSSRFLVHYALGGVRSLTPTLRLRCRLGVFHRRAAPLRSPVRARPSSRSSFLLIYVLQAVPLPGVGRQPTLRLALLPEVLHIRFVIPYKFSGCGLGLPPRRSWISALLSHSISFTLLRLLCLPGSPGGFQVATTGKTKSIIVKVFSIDMAVRDINNDIHDVARSRPRIFVKIRCGESATHRVSAWGLFGVGSWVGRFSSPSLVLLPSLGLFGLSCFRGCLGLLFFCSRASFPTALHLGELTM